MKPMRLVVALTGATGAVYGVRLLELLGDLNLERHVIVSRSGWLTLKQEMNVGKQALKKLTDMLYDVNDVGAALASGSFQHEGMVVAPCSMRSLAAIAHGFNDNLITRAADVTLKEHRPLVLLTRETPLNLAHLRNMLAVAEMGGRIMPPVPAFYAHPKSLNDMVNHTTWRVLDQFGLGSEEAYGRWAGVKHSITGVG